LELGVGRWALGVGRWALGVGRWALGFGRWALGVGRSGVALEPKLLSKSLPSFSLLPSVQVFFAPFCFNRSRPHAAAAFGVSVGWKPNNCYSQFLCYFCRLWMILLNLMRLSGAGSWEGYWQTSDSRSILERPGFKGSMGEIRAQLIYALDFGYLKPETFSELDGLAQTATACLGGLIRYLNNSSCRGRKFRRREDLANEPKPLKTPNTTPAS
jgi:hypothetical protein